MSFGSGVTKMKTLWVVVIILLLALLGYLSWPMRVSSNGVGVIQPEYEQLIRVDPPEDGIIVLVKAGRLETIAKGATLFEYIPHSQYAVIMYARMTKPGGETEPEPLSEFNRTIDSRRIRRTEAANRWNSQVMAVGVAPVEWERSLASRFATVIPREEDVIIQERIKAENIRMGQENANMVQVFDKDIGMYRATSTGIQFVSPVSGTLYSFWVTSRFQIFRSSPIAEIMPPGVPTEVLGLIHRDSPLLMHGPGIVDALALSDGRALPTTGVAPQDIRIGKVPTRVADAREILTDLKPESDSVFVRIRLSSPLPTEDFGKMVSFRIHSERRPRIWFWIKQYFWKEK
jgi:hypothetical protein